METSPLAMLLIIMAMVKGETRDGPRSMRRRHSSSMLLSPPIPLPHHHAKTLVVHVLQIDPGVGQSDFRGGHRQLGEPIGAAGVLWRSEILGRDRNPLTSPAILQS